MASLATPLPVSAATLTFAPMQDAYVSAAAKTTNFGTATTLQVGNTSAAQKRTYLMFDVQGLTGAPTSATLQLWGVSTSGAASTRTLADPRTAWGETSITNSNAPTLVGANVTTVNPVVAGAYNTWNVLSFVAGNGSFTLAITTADLTGSTFSSREDAAHPPLLTVVGPAGSTVPGAPTGASAVAGNTQATVSWTIPASDGGSAITGYTVTSSPGGFTGTASGPTATSATVSGLTNSTSYTFTVHATNGVGPGPESAASNAVTPSAPTVPGAPTNASAVAGNMQATVNWTIPASNGGSAITGYTVTSIPEGHTGTASGPTATSAIVAGMTNGTSYTFTVHATNGIGSGPESPPSNAVVPSTITVPGAPTNVGAAPGNAQATVNWTIPASDGGSAITSYTATSTPGAKTGIVSGAAATSVTVAGLTNGTSYTFTVHATNGIGSSVESAASSAVTPSTTLPVIRRYPYLTDTTTTSTLVNFATSASSPLPTVRWGLASGDCVSPPNTATASLVATLTGMPAGTDTQFKTSVVGLTAATAYCYRVYQSGADLTGVATTFRTALAAGSNTPFKFAVIGDWGQGTTDQANVAAQIGAAHPDLLISTGDNDYPNGSQAEYGDLTGGTVFPAQYLPAMGRGLPMFMVQGNHGFTTNTPYIQNFPQDVVTAASGGKFVAEAYSNIPGSSNATYASAWFAFTWGRARFYVLEAAWADANGAYSGDYQAHWNTGNMGCTPACGAEMTWLQNDLAANASVPLKFAFFHYPLHVDSPSEVSDTNLSGPSPKLEGVLAAAKVAIVFNGHAHQYQRNFAQIAGSPMVSYVTGGGGASLGSIGTCTVVVDAYGIAPGKACGTASVPPNNTYVFHYLLVSVNGNQVTVTPTDEMGRTFDVQTYTIGPLAPTGLSATAGDNSVALSWTASAGATSYNVKRATLSGGPYTTISTPGAVTGTTYTDSTATNGTTYYYVVSAVGDGGEGADSTQVSATPQPPAPGAPTNLTPTAGDNSVALSWTASAGATSYNVKRATLSGGPYTTISTPGAVTGTTYTDSTATNGTTYYYVVSAVGDGGEGADSTQVSATPQPPAPGAPTNLTPTAGDNSVALSWTASAGATSYNVKRATLSGGPYTTISTPGAVTGTTYTDSTATNGTTYYYVVSAVGDGGEGADSTQVSATPQPPAPGAPTNLTPTAGDNSVALSWTASAGATSYNVKRATLSGGPYTTISTPGAVTGTTYTDSTATNGTTYYYVVSAVGDGGEGADSTQVSATPQPPAPGAPTNLTPTAGDNSVALSWTASAGATSYNVKRATLSGGPYTTISTPGAVTGTTYTDSTATNGTTYYYVVSAVGDGGEGADSTQVSATPQPPAPGAPTNLTPTAGDNSVALSWTASAGATSYNVKRATLSGGPYTTISTPGAVTGTTYTDSTATNGTTYYYVVSAVGDGGEGADSTQVSATPLSAAAPVSYPAVIRNSVWYLRDSNTSAPGTITSFAYGNPTDTPIFGDWNNDGVATPGVVRVTGGSLTWYLRNTNSAGAPDTIFAWGAATDKPLVGDWDGNGTDTPGLLRASNHWILSNSGDGTSGIVDFFWGSGAANEKPIVGDWDGNGSDTPGLVRAGNWWILKTSNDASSTVTDFFWGTTSETAWVVGDWNGDGSDNPGILRGNWWLLRDSNTGGGATDRDFFFGLNSDTFRVWAK